MGTIFLAGLIGLITGAAAVRFVKVQKASGWSNREFDGTLIIMITGAAFFLLIVLSFLKPEFSTQQTTSVAFEIIKTLFTFMCGYTFKTGVEQKANELHDPRKQQEKK